MRSSTFYRRFFFSNSIFVGDFPLRRLIFSENFPFQRFPFRRFSSRIFSFRRFRSSDGTREMENRAREVDDEAIILASSSIFLFGHYYFRRFSFRRLSFRRFSFRRSSFRRFSFRRFFLRRFSFRMFSFRIFRSSGETRDMENRAREGGDETLILAASIKNLLRSYS